ncbi:MAG: NAD-dependent epimerase/dehydratase family protein [Gemmatimonadaceae bacterium]|nr:NAD-dependent epimerase/dehydratase family protein [Gemmatimonadaceae bacterium]
MRTAMVTGGTGLLGSYVVERLLADGWAVRTLVRDSGRSGWLSRIGAEVRPGDVLDAPGFAAATRGCELVVHAAAAIFHRDGWDGYERSNVMGTANAITAARTAGARLVHVSSVAVYGPGGRYMADGRRTGEDVELAPIPASALYARSKRDSEALVMQAHADRRVWATAVRPCVIYGQRDRQFVPRMARLLERGLVPLIDGGRSTMAIVHAANVADGIARAATTEAAGGRSYNLADDFPVTVADFFRLGAEGIGIPLHTVRVPRRLARAAAAVVERVGPLLGMNRSVASAKSSLNFISRDNPFSSDRAREELGWTPFVHHEVGVPEAFRWWRMNR